MKKIKYLNKYVVFVLVALAVNVLFYSFFQNTLMAYDSMDYWNKSHTFITDQGFSLFNYPHYFRGIVFPFYIFIARNIFGVIGLGDIASFQIFNAVFIALFLGWVIPYGMKRVFDKESKWWQIFGLALLLNFFYPGLIQTTLSDFFALSMYVSSLLVLYCALKEKYGIYRILLGLFAGILAYCAYNARTIYLYSYILTVIIVIFMKIDYKTKSTVLVVGLCGFLLTSTPQMIINHNGSGQLSFAVPVQVIPGMKEDLNLFQFRTGIMYQRYQTYIGPNSAINPGNAYYDAVGTTILDNEKIEYFNGFDQYLNLVFKYPVSFVGIYFRNVCNFLDNRFGEIYITDLTVDKTFNVFLNLSLILTFIAGLTAMYTKHKKEKSQNEQKSVEKFWLLLVVAFPSICTIPGAPEIRFFISLFLVLYVVVLWLNDYKEIVRLIKSNKIISLFLAIFVICVLLSIWSESFMHMNSNVNILG